MHAHRHQNGAVVHLPLADGEGFGGHFHHQLAGQQRVQRPRRVVAVPAEGVGIRGFIARYLAHRKAHAVEALAEQAAGGGFGHGRQVEPKGAGQGPGRDVVKNAVFEGAALLKHGLDEPELGLVGRHHVGVGGRISVPVEFQVTFGPIHRNLVLPDDARQLVGASRVFRGTEYVGAHRLGAGFFGGFLVKLPLIIQHVDPQRLHGFDGRKRGRDLVADGEGEAHHAVGPLLGVPARAGLLEKYTHGPVYVRISRALAVVEIVVVLLSEVQGADFVQRLGVEGPDFLGQLEVALRRERVLARRHAGLEKERGIGAHLVVIGQ